MSYEKNNCHPPHPKQQHHVHEVQGSVKIAEPIDDPHNHRFATVSGEAIPTRNGDHVHEVVFRTDFYEEHFHEFCGKTSGGHHGWRQARPFHRIRDIRERRSQTRV